MRSGKAPFSIQKRPASKKEALRKRAGKKYGYVYYVQFRDVNGDYTSAISSGKTSRGAAEDWAYNYLRQGNAPMFRGFTFERFAADWWIAGRCPYLKEKQRTGRTLSPRYVEESRRNLEKRLLPAFGQRKLDAIRLKDIREWMFRLYEEEGINPATINRSLATLKIMLKEAVRLGYLQSNPAKDIGVFKEEPKAKTILTLEEVRKLFGQKALRAVWQNDLAHYTANLLAASTGMRLGEIQALQRQDVHEGFVEVRHSWSRKYGLKDPKNHRPRPVPIPSVTEKHLDLLMEASPYKEPEHLVFSTSSGAAPLDGKEILDQLYAALQKIGIDERERKARNITFHSWRYFFNTLCRSQHVPDAKTRIVMGHQSAQMTERYTAMALEDLAEIRLTQERMFKSA